MSYNIDSIRVLKCSAKILAKDVLRLSKLPDLPESVFLDEMLRAEPDADGFITVNADKFWWQGKGSGNTWPTFLKKIAPRIVGKLEAVVTWEGGDSVSGLRVRDGVVTEPEVVMSLADEPETK